MIVDLRLLIPIRPLDFHQHRQKLVWRQIGRPCDVSAVSSQEHSGGPTADVISEVNIGPMVVIDSDRYKMMVYIISHLRIDVGDLVHHVAPVAPDCADGKQHWLVLCLCLSESRTAPRQPLNLV